MFASNPSVSPLRYNSSCNCIFSSIYSDAEELEGDEDNDDPNTMTNEVRRRIEAVSLAVALLTMSIMYPCLSSAQ
jgi:hypothetical protein